MRKKHENVSIEHTRPRPLSFALRNDAVCRGRWLFLLIPAVSYLGKLTCVLARAKQVDRVSGYVPIHTPSSKRIAYPSLFSRRQSIRFCFVSISCVLQQYNNRPPPAAPHAQLPSNLMPKIRLIYTAKSTRRTSNANLDNKQCKHHKL